MSKRPNLDILGAGLCGSLLAIMLARRGFPVTVRETRADPRKGEPSAGRSINLALSARGIRALEHAGVFERVESMLMPMRGRMIHERDGETTLLPYGQRDDELIYSVSRGELNRVLIDAAERDYGVRLLFEHTLTAFDADSFDAFLRHGDDEYRLPARALIAADGAGSLVRRSFAERGDIQPSESLLPHGYKELTIPARPDGGFELDPAALHIWPRSDFMLIALPNPGGDFTLTLFLPNDGERSFRALQSDEDVEAFFAAQFADVMPLIPDLSEAFRANPVGILGTVRCLHWHVGGRFLLLGDAAHAIVPFHGQGMNLAFEDCLLLDQLVGDEESPDWNEVFESFEGEQHKNANAIADMALENYVEMRDTVRDPRFALKKDLAFELERRLPDRFIPRYSMVMFHAEIPYATAQQRGRTQSELLEQLTRGASNIGDIDLDAAEALARERLTPLVRA